MLLRKFIHHGIQHDEILSQLFLLRRLDAPTWNLATFLMLAYSLEATFPENKACCFLARKSSIGGTRNFPWPWWSHGNFHRFCRGFPWPGLGEGCLFSSEKWRWSLKSGDISTLFCHEYVIAKGTGLSSACFFWMEEVGRSVRWVRFFRTTWNHENHKD